MSYMPNRRCRHACAAGRKARFVQQVSHHAARLEEWHRYWKNQRKWRRWSVAMCEFHVRRSEQHKSRKAEQIYLLDHHLRKSYCVFERWPDGGRADDVQYPYKRQRWRLRLVPPIKEGRRLPTYDELMSMDEEGGGKLGPVYSLVGLNVIGLHETDVEAVEDHLHEDMLDIFRMHDFLPPHFPKDFRFVWICTHCGSKFDHEPNRLTGTDSLLCDTCYADGMCDNCKEWSNPDCVYYQETKTRELRICEGCREQYAANGLVLPLEDYLEAEHIGYLTEPLDQDVLWQSLMSRFRECIIKLHGYDHRISVWVDDPKELVDEAIVVVNSHGNSYNTRIPWYERKGWEVRLPRLLK